MSASVQSNHTPQHNEYATRRSRVELSLVVAAALVAWLIWQHRGTPRSSSSPVLRSGAQIVAPITLVTADRHDLSCAMAGELQGYQCAYESPEQPTARRHSPDSELAPYMTTSGKLLLIAGLFEQPAVRERYRGEPPQGRKRDTLRRFTAECKLRLLGEVEAGTRWVSGGGWEPPTRAWAGVPSDCHVFEP